MNLTGVIEAINATRPGYKPIPVPAEAKATEPDAQAPQEEPHNRARVIGRTAEEMGFR